MLDRLTLENWFHFKLIDVELKPLTVLIGDNETGKATFRQAVCSVARQKSIEARFFQPPSRAFSLDVREFSREGGILLVQQPENGLYHHRLESVVEFWRDLTTWQPPIQVILTTYSPYLLDHVDLETDQVLVFRAKDGHCTVDPIDRDHLTPFLNEGQSLGQVWGILEEEPLVREQAKEESKL